MKIAQNSLFLAKMGGVAVALALPLVNVESAGAIIFVENLSQTSVSGTAFGQITGTVNVRQGTSFTTDNDSYTLNSLIAPLRETTQGNLSIELYTNNGSEPGTLIESLSTTSDVVSGSFNNYLFTPDSPVTLDANTTYWLAGFSTGSYAWERTSSSNENSIGAWTIGNTIERSDNGSGSWFTNGTLPYQFAVDATSASASVPFEFSPAMGLLLMGGLFGGKAALGKYKANVEKNCRLRNY